MLFLRRYLITNWINEYFNDQLRREKMNVPYIEFSNLDALLEKYVPTEVATEHFLTASFVLEVIAQLIFPWPGCEWIYYMPQYA